ncbi:MAG: DsbA family oxidoreductase [Achromobacter sp.]|nr:DsbA family oxidoreductase [Achromobacter sp.]
MREAITLDFVSDVVCPWCAIGLCGLLEAIQRVDGEIDVELRIKPFELNADMPAEGEDLVEHLQRKYGSSAEDIASNHKRIRDFGEEVGFHFDLHKRQRIYNTFDAHRLLHWAAEQGRDLALKQALLHAYFGEGRNISDNEELLDLATGIGLGVQAGAKAALAYAQRKTRGEEQDAIAMAAGPLAVGKVASWRVEHQLPIESDAQGQVTVSRLIGGVDLECKEVVFSIDTPADKAGAPPAREFYVTTVCRDGAQWRWASAEPATARWGSLQ